MNRKTLPRTPVRAGRPGTPEQLEWLTVVRRQPSSKQRTEALRSAGSSSDLSLVCANTDFMEMEQRSKDLLARTLRFPKLHAQAVWLTDLAKEMRDKTKNLPPRIYLDAVHGVPDDIDSRLWEIRDQLGKLISFRSDFMYFINAVESSYDHIEGLERDKRPRMGLMASLFCIDSRSQNDLEIIPDSELPEPRK